MKTHGYFVVMMAQERHTTLLNVAEQEQRLRAAGIIQSVSQRLDQWVGRWWRKPPTPGGSSCVAITYQEKPL